MTSRRPWIALALAGAGLCLTTSCSSSAITSDRVDAAVGPTFSRLYVLAQHQLGNDVITRPDGHASCRRGAAAHRNRGAGDDWSCAVDFPFPDGHIEPITYDLHVQPGGCYTADGPAQIVGPQRRSSAAGAPVTNPLFEFDGCFDIT